MQCNQGHKFKGFPIKTRKCVSLCTATTFLECLLTFLLVFCSKHRDCCSNLEHAVHCISFCLAIQQSGMYTEVEDYGQLTEIRKIDKICISDFDEGT